ncbi:dipeptide transmembrane transporter [Xylariomycetidae sp. FL2044]|nr:dipeptide transmembrane transporter [Xylariomycetidae sp. FL2044]
MAQDIPGAPAHGANEKKDAQLIVTKDADIGLQFIAEHGRVDFTSEEECGVRWRLDLYLMPILMITYGLQYLDKVTISYAAVYDMEADLRLVGQQYAWSSSVFYVGYLVGQPPANYLLQRFPIGKFAAVSLFVWGGLVMLCAVCDDFAGLAALRFLMGVFESGISPAWTHLTAMFYKKQEQGARCTAWFFMVGFAVMIGGLISYGVGHTHTAVRAWQLVFLVCGGFTVFWSLVVFFFLPDSPLNARFLSARERAVAVERLRGNRTGVKTARFKTAQAREALRDPQVWLLTLITLVAQLVNIAGSFLPLIIRDMGFSGLATTLLTLPTSAVECVAMVVAGAASLLFVNGRTAIIFCISLPTLAGCAMLAAIPRSETWARVVASWLLLASPAGFALMLSLIGSNIAGFSKKVTTTTLTFIAYCVGNIICPQLFISTEAPDYGTAMRGMLSAMVIVLLLEAALGFYYVCENRRRDRILAETPPEVIDAMTAENEEYLDRTDMEDFLKFRYRW